MARTIKRAYARYTDAFKAEAVTKGSDTIIDSPFLRFFACNPAFHAIQNHA